MKVIVFVLLAALAVYCTAKPLKELEEEARLGADVWNNGLPMLTLPFEEEEAKLRADAWNNGLPMVKSNVKGKKLGTEADISKKAFPGMTGLKTLDEELMKDESSWKKTNEAFALQFGQMGSKHLKKILDSTPLDQYQVDEREIETGF